MGRETRPDTPPTITSSVGPSEKGFCLSHIDRLEWEFVEVSLNRIHTGVSLKQVHNLVLGHKVLIFMM